MEAPLLPTNNSPKKTKQLVPKLLGVATLAVIAIGSFYSFNRVENAVSDDSLCPILQEIDPRPYVYDFDKIGQILKDKEFEEDVVQKWRGAIQIPSISYDEMVNPNATDNLDELYKLEPVWEQFSKLHDYLEKSYPLVHEKLKVEKINKFALLYTWEGSNPDKKPILLTAHQDVVPVPEETVDQWKYPPFEGTRDGDKLYGRGAADCKDLMMALLDTVELLLKEGKFKPDRTILVGFGYDEESQGTGGYEIAQFLLKRYGEESLYALIDEGAVGYGEANGVKMVDIPTSEKGHLNSEIELFTPGGHSSVPPKYTSIGIMAKLIDRIEDVDFDHILTRENPLLNRFQCLAEHTDMDKTLKSDILRAQFDKKANDNLIKYLSETPVTEALIKTTQAIDIIQGGLKSNALPEHVSLLVNHRIAAEESVESTGEKILKDIKYVADKFDLGIVYQNTTIKEPTKNGYFNYVLLEALEPSPVSPIDTEVWKTFGGSLRYFYENILHSSDEQYIIAPAISGGNTDTKSYWDLTANIYRYAPGFVEVGDEAGNVHSISEYSSVKGHMAIISFYYSFLQIADQAKDI